uniref:G-protein coupled receptors family 2 profile 2 domain-containing protein n=1 Tax=Arcella intermedia TaxID=1963864 RepID=A0A6B2LB81_9EUKA
MTSCSLSMVGSLMILLTYVAWEDMRSTVRRMLVFLSLGDFFVALGNLFGVVYDIHANSKSVYCKIQSFITTGFSMYTFLWTMFIGIYMLLIITKRKRTAMKLIPLFHLITLFVPLIIVCVAMAYGALGYSMQSGTRDWCWISDHYMIYQPHFEQPLTSILFWQIVAGKGIEIFAYIVTPIVYLFSRRELGTNESSSLFMDYQILTIQDIDRKLILIPLIFFGARVWGTIRFLGVSTGLTVIKCQFWLAVLQGFGDSAQGFFNAILFVALTRKIRDKFKLLLCCKEEKELESWERFVK